MDKIKVGIVGYGNIGRGAQLAVAAAGDMQLRGIFTRRSPAELSVSSGVPVYTMEQALEMKNEIDVMLLCGGSSRDLPEQAPALAKLFNIVDTYDNHARIPEYFAAVDAAATDKVAVISAGWDPGLFSVMRMMLGAVIPNGKDYTFWGRGVSQGHSEAIRRLKGVKSVERLDGLKGAVQYTIPNPAAINAVRGGGNPDLSVRDRHTRECYVVAEDGADLAELENAIKQMPDYFAPYETVVHFITEDDLLANHMNMPHGGFVFRSGELGGNKQLTEFKLQAGSNPEFTACVMTAFARAAVKLHREGHHGAKTVFDLPLSYLSPLSRDELIRGLL